MQPAQVSIHSAVGTAGFTGVEPLDKVSLGAISGANRQRGEAMQKVALTFAAALILSATTASYGHAAKLRPGWYAHSLLVYGNNGYERLAAGCLQWHWQNRSWYDHCGARGSVVVTKF